MASRGCGRKGCPWGSGRPPPGFDQQAFTEAVGVAATTIAQASVAGGQGGVTSRGLWHIILHHSGKEGI